MTNASVKQEQLKLVEDALINLASELREKKTVLDTKDDDDV